MPNSQIPPPALKNERAVWALLGAVWLGIFYWRAFGPTSSVCDDATTGTLASGLIDGLAAPVRCYEYNWINGSVVYGFLLWPVYRLFGPSAFWIKLFSSFFIAGGVFLWTRVLRNAWGRGPALLFFVWSMFPPPLLEGSYHVAYGLHIESLLFTGLLLFLFNKAAPEGPRFWEAAALGVVAGFAAYFSQENLAFIAAAATAGSWRWGRRGLWRLAWPGAAAFAIGYLPRAFSVQMPFDIPATLARFFSARCWLAWGDMLAVLLPRCAAYRGFGGVWLSVAWFGLSVAGAAAAMAAFVSPKRTSGVRDWLAVVLLLDIFFFIFAYGAAGSGMFAIAKSGVGWTAHDMRYLVAIGLSLLALAAYLIAAGRPTWRLLLAVPFLAAGAANIVFDNPPAGTSFADGLREVAARRGDDYRWFVRVSLPGRYWPDSDLETALTSVRKLPPRWREEGLVALGRYFYLFRRQFVDVRPDGRFADREEIALAAGAGMGFADWWFSASPGPKTERVATATERLRAGGPVVAAAFVEGFCRGRYDMLADQRPGFNEYKDPGATAAIKAEVGAIAATTQAIAAQLGPREIRLAMAAAAGRWSGENMETQLSMNRDLSDAVVDSRSQFGGQFLQDPEDPEEQAAFCAGFSAGVAFLIKNKFLRFAFLSPKLDFQAIRRALLTSGVALRPSGRRENEFELDIQ